MIQVKHHIMRQLLSILLIAIAAMSCKDLRDDEDTPGVSEMYQLIQMQFQTVPPVQVIRLSLKML